MNTATVSLAVTPTVVGTLLSHVCDTLGFVGLNREYVNRKPRHQKPTAHLSYDQGLHLIRSFLLHASRHTVEDLQAFTSQWVPHPQWVKLQEVSIGPEHLDRAAAVLSDQLGPDGLRAVGGVKWWQWRKPSSNSTNGTAAPLKAEWVEMRTDYHERKRAGNQSNRVMFYVHGGAYYFGSVDEHRYQLQRHARKIKGRVFAPRYRLAPQFPFPCGLQDCLAAYLYLLTVQDPSTIVVAGDSAGGGMVMSLLVTLRDQGIPLPAGTVLISPWVDLTHSFPSLAGDCPFDYIPKHGFHHKPSRAWPPLNADEFREITAKAVSQAKKGKDVESSASPAELLAPTIQAPPCLSVLIDGAMVELREQIQMYTTNELLSHPLVSTVLQPTLGGLPPMLIMVGGGEVLRDEQIYLAHKCANPAKYLPPDSYLDEKAQQQLREYKPTDVQLQVWEDLCHVAPTLSFTRPAKYMYRSVAQFSAWVLARAQNTGIDILDDDQISIISSGSDDDNNISTGGSEPTNPTTTNTSPSQQQQQQQHQPSSPQTIGKAGDPLPAFKSHMIRQRVTRNGNAFPLEPASQLPACVVPRDDIGAVKPDTARKWLATRAEWDARFASAAARVRAKLARDLAAGGYETFGAGETPPPTALAGRRRLIAVGLDDEEGADRPRSKSWGLALWSLWGSKHDEATVQREKEADREPDTKVATAAEGTGARPFDDLQAQEGTKPADTIVADSAPPPGRLLAPGASASRSRSRRRTVVDEHQTGSVVLVDENTPAATLLALQGAPSSLLSAAAADGDSSTRRPVQEGEPEQQRQSGMLSPDSGLEMGVAGKRPKIDGIAMPFTLHRDADTASMITLTSALGPSPTNGSVVQLPNSRPMSPVLTDGGEEATKGKDNDLPLEVKGTVEN